MQNRARKRGIFTLMLYKSPCPFFSATVFIREKLGFCSLIFDSVYSLDFILVYVVDGNTNISIIKKST